MSYPEVIIQKTYFPDITFSDEREYNVFLSYLRGFGLLIYDQRLTNILEIGGGQSTSILAELGLRLGWHINTIDMNPDAVAMKIRNESATKATLNNVSFYRGLSVPPQDIREYFQRCVDSIGGVPFDKVMSVASTFIETSMDPRKMPYVAKALGLDKFSVLEVVDAIRSSRKLPLDLVNVFRTPGDELEFNIDGFETSTRSIRDVMDSSTIDLVFLDSGEFSSLVEWEVVEPRLRPGGYAVLHDIFFPKSFKNWLVCSSIWANPDYTTLYIDRSTPQGLMIAQKKTCRAWS